MKIVSYMRLRLGTSAAQYTLWAALIALAIVAGIAALGTGGV